MQPESQKLLWRSWASMCGRENREAGGDWANDANEISWPAEGSVNDGGFEPDDVPVNAESFLPAPARAEPPWAELPPITGPQQYQVQFSTTEEHVQLIERAKALLARSTPASRLASFT